MAWNGELCSNSGDTTVESFFDDYNQDQWSFYTCPEPGPSSSSPSYHLSRLPSYQSHPSTDLEVDDTKTDPSLPSDTSTLLACFIQPSKLIIQPNPPPLAAGHNYHPQTRAEEHAQVFSELPPELNIPGTSLQQNDNMLEDIQVEIDRLAARSPATQVPLSVEPIADANGNSRVVNSHRTDANGRPCHGECGPHTCSVCQKSFCEETRLTRHVRSHKKPYVCGICGATRTWVHHLNRHMATHRDETFTCPMYGCSKTFTTTANIPRHLQNSVCHGLTKERSKQVMAEYKRTLQRAT